MPLPLFVIGAQRSGSTMLGSMIGGHSRVLCVPEGQFIADLIPNPPLSPVNGKDIIDNVMRSWRFKAWELDLASARPTAEDEQSYQSTIEWLVRQFGIAVGKADFDIWVDQQPGHIRHVQKLKTAFPQAKFIHIVRDGRAVCASILPLDWGPNTASAAAQFWTNRIANGLAAQHWLGPQDCCFMRYEDVVSDPENAMKSICTFLQIDFDAAMLANNGLRLPSYTKYQHGLVGELPNPERINSWKNTLTTRQIADFEYETWELLGLLNYDYPTVPTRILKERERTTSHLLDQTKKLLNRVRFRRRVKQVEAASLSAQQNQSDTN